MRKGHQILFKKTISDWFLAGTIQAGTMATVIKEKDGCWTTFDVNGEAISIGRHQLTNGVIENITLRNQKRKRAIKAIQAMK